MKNIPIKTALNQVSLKENKSYSQNFKEKYAYFKVKI